MGLKQGERYTRLGVKLRVHGRAHRVGTFAMGVYSFAQMQARDEEQDGLFSVAVVVNGCWGSPHDQVRDALSSLCDVGYLEVVDGDTYRVVNYADWNETTDEIVERRDRDRLRKKSKRCPPVVRAESERTPTGVPDSDSDSLSVSSDRKIGSEIQAESASVTRLRAVPDRPEPHPIPPTFELRAEDRAFAEQLAIRDVDLVWMGFTSHYAASGRIETDWRAKWRQWCATETKRQRAERDRERARGGPKIMQSHVGRCWEIPKEFARDGS